MSDHVISKDSNNRPTEVLLDRNRLIRVPNRSLVTSNPNNGLTISKFTRFENRLIFCLETCHTLGQISIWISSNRSCMAHWDKASIDDDKEIDSFFELFVDKEALKS